MSKFTYSEEYTKDDLTKVRISSTLYIDFNDKYYTETFAHYLKPGETEWKLCNKDPKYSREEMNKMSREEYIKNGRPELFVIVGVPKLLKVAQELLNTAKAKYPNITPMTPFGH